MEHTKVALITGCSDPTSLGAALALDLLSRNWKVFATAINVDSMSALDKAGCTVFPLDVTDESQIQEAAQIIGNKLDLLINNAAVEGLSPLLDTDLRRLQDMFQVNVFGPLRLIQSFADALIDSRGCIVNIGSVGIYGLPFHGAYASSKAAFQTISDVLRRETAPMGIHVITVELAMVMTAMLRGENPFDLQVPESLRSPHFARWYSTIAPRYRSDLVERSKKAMPASTAAQQIIDHIEKEGNKKIWIGTMAWIFRWLWPFLSTARQDQINNDLLHVHLLKTKVD
ncbi:uncharacterized protein I303_102269 [Kwoniella dejecticola CBS 10117]|uniref:Uncharacterized protein n=1 Tax=Kwoniella dejecticola CBS 10117 TaxID=1296121 RepID=A0A1A6ABG0_9TREE|nr:uncharacterized protein I303_01591 [Kwoniella dejecticola CBS 10117]OBR87389.1 hypothetical protein I303_01591 [Kwoniella dejecticola CBS 10117]